MVISLGNLRTGIGWWLENTKWTSEFVNDEYHELYLARKSGINEQWWKTTVKRLWNWKAIRARRPPNTQEEIATIGRGFLDVIDAQYRRIRQQSSNEPSIEQFSWDDVAPLFGLGLEIKCGSQVFACKMCHFLFPKLFLVIDNWATGVMDYEFCWRGMKDEWSRFSAKNEARRVLQEAIKSQKPLHPLYPLETKIMELSLIGYYWKSRTSVGNDTVQPAVVVRVAAEGGDVTLIGQQVNGAWRFRLQVNDCSAGFVDEDDAAGLPRESQNPPWVHSWPAALALLDRYPWAELVPQVVHPEFREPVWFEINRRFNGSGGRWVASANRVIEDWRQLCGIADSH